MRLIDADALNKQMYHEAFETDTDMQKWESGCWIRYKMFENAIAAAPTIEPTLYGYPIKHLANIACLMEEGNITPEDVAGQFMDITRMVTIVIQRMNEKIKDKIINGGWDERK